VNANSVESQKIIDTKVLGTIVRNSRRSLKLTQNELAGICGVGARFLSELESGKKTVEFTKVLQVLSCLGLELRLQKKGWT
jgi:y4mF family transcriptional regulator